MVAPVSKVATVRDRSYFKVVRRWRLYRESGRATISGASLSSVSLQRFGFIAFGGRSVVACHVLKEDLAVLFDVFFAGVTLLTRSVNLDVVPFDVLEVMNI